MLWVKRGAGGSLMTGIETIYLAFIVGAFLVQDRATRLRWCCGDAFENGVDAAPLITLGRTHARRSYLGF